MKKLFDSAHFLGYSIAIIFLVGHAVAPLPPGLQGCRYSLSDPEFDRCWLKFALDFRNNMKQGIPTANLPQLDPFFAERIDFKRYSKYFKLDATVRNYHMTGGSNYQIEEIHVDKDTLTFGMTMLYPFLDVNSDFEIVGTVLGVKVPTRGTVKAQFTNTRFTALGQFTSFTDSSGIEHTRLENLQSFLTLGDGPIDIKTPPNLQWAADMIIYFYGKSHSAMLKILTPMVNDLDDEIIMKMVQPIFYTIRRDELVIPS